MPLNYGNDMGYPAYGTGRAFPTDPSMQPRGINPRAPIPVPALGSPAPVNNPRGFPAMQAPPTGFGQPPARPPMPTTPNFGAQQMQAGFGQDPNGSFDALYQWLMSAGAMPHQAYLNAAGKTGAYGGGNSLNMMANLLNNPGYGYLDHMANLNQLAAARPDYVPPGTPLQFDGGQGAPIGAGGPVYSAPPPIAFSPTPDYGFQGPTPQYGQGPPPKTFEGPIAQPVHPHYGQMGNVGYNAVAAAPPQPPGLPYGGNAFQNFNAQQPQNVRGFWQY